MKSLPAMIAGDGEPLIVAPLPSVTVPAAATRPFIVVPAGTVTSPWEKIPKPSAAPSASQASAGATGGAGAARGGDSVATTSAASTNPSPAMTRRMVAHAMCRTLTGQAVGASARGDARPVPGPAKSVRPFSTCSPPTAAATAGCGRSLRARPPGIQRAPRVPGRSVAGAR